MTHLSNWREESDLFEVVTGKMTDEKALRKVDEKKGIKNKVVINPKLTEAIKELGGELIEATEEDEKGATVDPRKEAEKKSEDQKKKQIENKQKRAQMIKKQVLMKKLIAVRQGSEDIVAHHEPKGSYIKEASAVLDANTKIKNKDDRKKKEAELRRLLNHAIAMKKGRAESVEPEGEALDERLGGKGYKSYTSLTGKKVSGDWEDSDRGAGNKAKKRAGGKVEKKSPTYKAHVLNKEEVVNERTLSSYIPSDRQGEARRANLDYMKAQSKKKEDESTKNRGDLSKRDAGKMAKERLRTKKIMSMGEAKTDKALEFVRAQIIKKHGKGAIYDPKKKQSSADKEKVAAERKKRQDTDNKAYTARARKAGYKNTQDYTNVVARYGSEDNMKRGRGLGT